MQAKFIQNEVTLWHGKDIENIIIFSVITKINRFHLLIANLGKVLFLTKKESMMQLLTFWILQEIR